MLETMTQRISQLHEYLHGASEADTALAARARETVQTSLVGLPWKVRIRDWTGQTYACGGDRRHWSGHDALDVHIKTPAAARDLLALDMLAFFERYMLGEVDMSGNLYLFPEVRHYADLAMTPLQVVRERVRHFAFQSPSRAKVNVKFHYDIPQEALFYLDEVYHSYSCGLWENPGSITLDDALTIGEGEADTTDTLEKAQWRKFADAADFLAPRSNETVLDIGCGYPGFLKVLLERHPAAKAVGWTHSSNQVREGTPMLAQFDPNRYELNEGDYRDDPRIYDHINSIGMICHVGPRGLVPYVRNVRKRIRAGGRYVHHCMMVQWTGQPLDAQIGMVLNKKYVWPGFHYFTPAEHMKALEENGFMVVRAENWAPHYAKTVFSWRERLKRRADRFVAYTNEQTLRAWDMFMTGITGNFLNRGVHLYRFYCEAIDIDRPVASMSEPWNHPTASIHRPSSSWRRRDTLGSR